MDLKPFVSEDLFKMRCVGNPRVSPCGKKVAFVVTSVMEKENGYSSAIWLWTEDEDGGSLRQLTNLSANPKWRDQNPRWSEKGDSIAFLSNRSGSQQIWAIDLGGGEARQVTSMPKGVGEFAWAGSDTLVFSAKEDTGEPKLREGSTARRITRLRYKFNGAGYLDTLYTQLWKLDLTSGTVERLTEGLYNCSSPSPSPSGRQICFISTRTDDETARYEDLWLLDTSSGALRELTESKGEAYGPVWAGEDHIYYLGHDRGVAPGIYPDVWSVDLATGARRKIPGELPHLVGSGIGGDVRFDSGNTGLIPHGKDLYYAAVTGGNSYIYRLDPTMGQPEKVYGDGQMVVSSFHISQGTLALVKATPHTPGDLWVGKVDGEIRKVTGLNDEFFAGKYMGWPEPVEYTHPDGTKLEGWVIKPFGFREGEKYPMVMEIHGGPHSTYGNAFSHEFQMLAGHGYGVVYTNPRGSMGYGEAFSTAIVGDWCGVDARDLQFMAEQTLVLLPWADPARFGVTGGSQGGYFTNWLIGHTDMFSAAVTQRSMSNLYSKYGVSDIGWSYDRAGMGGKDLWDHEDFVMERSPMRYARNVKTPTLIIHSDQDFRCPLEQAEQWYVALKRLGVTAEMLLFHGENHELSRSGKPANRIVRLDAILEWFDRFLKR